MNAIIEIDLPTDLARFRLPAAVANRLQALLDLQEEGRPLTDDERAEAAGLVDLTGLLTLLRLRAERATRSRHGASLPRLPDAVPPATARG